MKKIRDRRRALPCPTTLTHNNIVYYLDREYCRGGSSITYLSTQRDDHGFERKYLIKEDYPTNMDLKRKSDWIHHTLKDGKVCRTTESSIKAFKSKKRRSLSIAEMNGRSFKAKEEPVDFSRFKYNAELVYWNDESFQLDHYRNPDIEYNTAYHLGYDQGFSDTDFLKVYDHFPLNNTQYTVWEIASGKMLSDYVEYGDISDDISDNLIWICKIIKELVYKEKRIYRKQFVHMDLSPENVFVSGNTSDMHNGVFLIDFGESVNLKYKSSQSKENVSNRPGYSAPELVDIYTNNAFRTDKAYQDIISTHLDIYSICSIFFALLDGSPPTCTVKGKFLDHSYFKDINPEAIGRIEDFITTGLSEDPQSRFAANPADALEEMDLRLKTIIRLLDAPQPYPETSFRSADAIFIGREQEQEEIHQFLQKDHAAVLKGIGGIGKSQIALKYCRDFQKEYDHVQFLVYSNSLEETIAGMRFVNADKIQYNTISRRKKNFREEEIRNKCEKHLQILGDSGKTLLVIDNYDEILTLDDTDDFEKRVWKQREQSLLSKLKELQNIDLLITSRTGLNSNSIDITHLCEKDAIHLFKRHYRYDLDKEEETSLKQIIRLTSAHTLTVALIGKLAYKLKKYKSGDRIVLKEIVKAFEQLQMDEQSFGSTESRSSSQEENSVIEQKKNESEKTSGEPIKLIDRLRAFFAPQPIERNQVKMFDEDITHQTTRDGFLENRNIFKHIEVLIDFDNFTHRENNILKYLPLIPVDGMPVDEFYSLIFPSEETTFSPVPKEIENLEDSGWIKVDCGIISVHPLFSEVFFRKFGNDSKCYDSFIESFLRKLDDCKAKNHTFSYILKMAYRINWKIKDIQNKEYANIPFKYYLYVINRDFDFNKHKDWTSFSGLATIHVLFLSLFVSLLCKQIWNSENMFYNILCKVVTSGDDEMRAVMLSIVSIAVFTTVFVFAFIIKNILEKIIIHRGIRLNCLVEIMQSSHVYMALCSMLCLFPDLYNVNIVEMAAIEGVDLIYWMKILLFIGIIMEIFLLDYCIFSIIFNEDYSIITQAGIYYADDLYKGDYQSRKEVRSVLNKLPSRNFDINMLKVKLFLLTPLYILMDGIISIILYIEDKIKEHKKV